MSKQEKHEGKVEKTLTYVYIPEDNIYGTIKSYGAWVSLIEYYDTGIKYTIEIPNDEFRIVDEIGIGYIDETGDNL
jgi:hypothetical protein